VQASSQQQVIQQQQARLADLEASARQWEARCSDLRDMAAGHEARAREAASEVLKGNQIIERLQVRERVREEAATAATVVRQASQCQQRCSAVRPRCAACLPASSLNLLPLLFGDDALPMCVPGP
jgi:hypothetical protein